MCALRLYKFRGSTNVSSSVPQRINFWPLRPYTRPLITQPLTDMEYVPDKEEERMANVSILKEPFQSHDILFAIIATQTQK